MPAGDIRRLVIQRAAADMLAVMRDENADARDRFEAAKAAAPYVHPRRAAVQHTDKDASSAISRMNAAELREYIATAGNQQVAKAS